MAISFSIPNFCHWREISGSMKTAEGPWNSSGLLQVTVLQEDGTRSSLKDDRGQWNGTVTTLCHPPFFGKCKVNPLSHCMEKGKREWNLTAKPIVGYALRPSVCAAISCSLRGMTPQCRFAGSV